ncbi:hypothetical protein M9H77_35189 [Catharanthus roseus]|uniref:Uncharacterized protein n=1 Tax=Catharanthus roseus TaxID=4058 RepID=A0ACB9ZQ22_CATRO|nr:hypothetical protein M9H77_35189 [Catharanthus roseus]
MIRPSGRGGDDDHGPVTDRTGQVQGHIVRASSRGVGGRHSKSDLLSTPTLFLLVYIMIQVHRVYDPYLAAPTVRPHISYRFSAQEPLTKFSGPTRQLGVEFFEQIVGAVQPDSSYSTHGYTARDYGVSSSEPFVERQPTDLRFEGLTDSFMSVMSKILGTRNKSPDKARDIGPTEGGPVDPKLIPSYGGHAAGPIWRGQVLIFILPSTC